MRKRRKEKQLKENFDPKNFRQEIIQIQSRRPFSINWFLFRRNEIFLEIFCEKKIIFVIPLSALVYPLCQLPKLAVDSGEWKPFLDFIFVPKLEKRSFYTEH